MLHFVYEEIDPSTDIPGYVGITNDPNERHGQHLADHDGNPLKIAWIQDLLQRGLSPKMRIIEIVEDRETAIEREKYWIRTYFEQGIPLTNVVDVPRVFRHQPRPIEPPPLPLLLEGDKYHLLLQGRYIRPYSILSLNYEWNGIAGEGTDLNFLQAFYDMHDLSIYTEREEQDILNTWLEEKHRELFSMTKKGV